MKLWQSAARWISILVLQLAIVCQERTVRGAFIPVVEHGPSSNRINAFFLGDGYTAADITAGTYATHVQGYVDYLFTNAVKTDPFFRYRNFFNIYRVNVTSNQSGADEPQNGITRDTALDATYRYDGTTDRLLYINQTKADNSLNSAIAGSGKTVNMRYVTVNDAVYGGGGGKYAVYAGANSSAREVALHEVAHSFSNLADEYGGNTGTYTGSEPSEVNVTKNSAGTKWSQWLGYNDPTGSVVGAYEGGKYYDHGIYRPTSNSKMRSLNVAFNAVGREAIILDFYRIVDPLDSYTANAGTLANPTLLSASRIDDAVIKTQWFVDNVNQPSLADLASINPVSLGLTPGFHTLKLRAYDPTGFDPTNGWVRINTNLLEQFVTWNVVLNAMLAGDVNADNSVNQLDLNVVFGSWLTTGATLAQGDANHDGVVNQLDINTITGNWLATNSTSTPMTVPESATFRLLGLGMIGFASYRRRRR